MARRVADGIASITIKLELGTLRALLNRCQALTGDQPPPVKELFAGVEYPKETRDPNQFLTWAEIEPRTAGPDDPLWDRLFLTAPQVEEFLRWVATAPNFQPTPYLPPMPTAAAHTGARLAELTRSRVEDWDLPGRTVSLREKKRSRVGDTFRRVPVAAGLADALATWLAHPRHPGGTLVFCRRRDRRLTSSHACRALGRYLKHSKWRVLRGFHVLRHSLASNLAAAGTDQRVIDEIMGHQTEAMQRRYRPFAPAARTGSLDRLYAV